MLKPCRLYVVRGTRRDVPGLHKIGANLGKPDCDTTQSVGQTQMDRTRRWEE